MKSQVDSTVIGIHLSAPWISVTDFIAIQWLPSGGPTNFPPPESHCYSKANNVANLLLRGCVGVIWWLFIDRGWQHERKQPCNHHPTSHFDRINANKSCIVLRPLFSAESGCGKTMGKSTLNKKLLILAENAVDWELLADGACYVRCTHFYFCGLHSVKRTSQFEGIA